MTLWAWSAISPRTARVLLRVSMAWLALPLLPQRRQRPTDACLNRPQGRAQAGRNFLMTQSLKKGEEEGVSLLRWQCGQSVPHRLAFGSIGPSERRRQGLDDRLREGHFVGEASALTPQLVNCAVPGETQEP